MLFRSFKLATGTWVSVGPLRARAIALGDPYVQDVVITGINRDDVGALLFPQSDACRRLAGLEPGVDSLAQVLAAPAVRAFFQDLLNTLAAGATGSASRINRALLMHEAATLDSGEATDKGSINQRAVLARRAPLVEALYDDSTPDLLRPR